MPSTATINVYGYPLGVTNDQRTEVIRGTISITSGTYPLGPGGTGWTLNWGAQERVKSIPFNTAGTIMPIDCDFKSIANPPSGWVYVWNSVTGNMHLYVCANASSNSSGPLQEYNGNVPGSVVNDIIEFRAVFARIN